MIKRLLAYKKRVDMERQLRLNTIKTNGNKPPRLFRSQRIGRNSGHCMFRRKAIKNERETKQHENKAT